MKYIKYKGNKLSKLSLGTVQFGLRYGIANKNYKLIDCESKEIINYLYSVGINCFDTAQSYGKSEEILGNSLKNFDKKFLITKLSSKNFENNLQFNIENSLKRLNVKELYGLLVHDSEILYNWNVQYENKIIDLQVNKKIKYFGASIYTNEEFSLAINNSSIDIIQVPFNLFDLRGITEKWFEKAKKANKLIIIRSIFLQGLLLMDINNIPEKLEKAKIYLQELDNFCKKKQISRKELCLSFVDSLANNSIILFGCDDLMQAKENILLFNNLKKLDEEYIIELKDLFLFVEESVYNPSKWDL